MSIAKTTNKSVNTTIASSTPTKTEKCAVCALSVCCDLLMIYFIFYFIL